MKKKLIKYISQVIFLGILSVITLGGLGRTIFFPKEINDYENRTAEQLPSFSVAGFLSSEFQNQTELALGDQVFFAEFFKKEYNNAESTITYSALKNIYETYPDKYFRYNDIMVFDSDYLLFEPRLLTDELKEKMNVRADSINAVTSRYQDVDFYLYYIEKDTDINFETNDKMGLYEYLQSIINMGNCKAEKYSINSFDEFARYFYKSDHHWNHIGAYRAYTQLVDFLGAGQPLDAGREYYVGEDMKGSKTAFAKNTELWNDTVYAYTYDFPKMIITENGSIVDDYGNQNMAGTAFITDETPLSYASLYGNDSGEIIFDTGTLEKPNILIIGESYDNAILKLLAAHYNKTVSIDLRSYDYMMNKTFDFASYLAEYEIDQVLLIGNVDYFLNTKFNLE